MKNKKEIKINEYSVVGPEKYSYLENENIFTDEDRRLLEKLNQKGRRIKVEKLIEGGLQIQSFQWVGTIEFTNFIIQVYPKFEEEIKDLTTMIEFSHGINLELYDQIDQFSSGENYLAELVIRMFRYELDKVLKKGIKKDYIYKEEYLKTLRGKPNIRRQITKHQGVPMPLECDFDDHTSNIPENQIIYDTLKVIQQTSINPKLLAWTNQMVDYFYSICSDESQKRNWVDHNFSYTRTNSYYEELHKICKLILGGKGIDEIFVFNGYNVHAFLINMNHLFELFIKSLLEMTKSQYNIKYQKGKRDSIIKQNGKSYKEIKPDFLVYSKDGKKVINIIDAKYKKYSNKEISQSDIYQVFFYGYAFYDDLENIKAHIIHPSNKSDGLNLKLIGKGSREGKLKIKGLNLEKTFNYIRKNDDKSLKQIANKLVSS